MRRLSLLLLVTCACWGAEPDEPEPGLPPDSTWLLYPEEEERADDAVQIIEEDELDLTQLSADVAAMARAAERIRAALRQNKIESFEDLIDDDRPAIIQQRDDRARRPDGEPLQSTRLGSDSLVVQRYSDGSQEVTASINGQRIRMIYGELLFLLKYKWNDSDVTNRNRRINVDIRDMPWDDALTRILGQAGLGWELRSDSEQEEDEIVIFETRSQPELDRAQLERLAEQALNRAALQRDNAIAAEALFRRADRERQLGRYRPAVASYLDLIRTFERQADDSPVVREWMRRCFLGLADCFNATGHYHEARTQYLTYIAQASAQGAGDDPRLPEVYLQAARASQELGKATGDVSAYLKAMELLDNLIQKYERKPEAATYITRAHNMLGAIHFVRGEYEAAKLQLLKYKSVVGKDLGHQLRFYLGECDFELAKQARLDYQHSNADALIESALSYYQEIAEAWRQGKKDPLVQDNVYWESFYRIGLCHINRSEPDFVTALYAFLEARRTFPQETIDGHVLVHIAHCYAELESDEKAIAALFELLKSERIDDGDLEMANLLGNIHSSLGDYPSPIRAKVLFYIAQAHHRAAKRDRMSTERYAQAFNAYRRVIEDEDPDPDLLIAARIGRARASFETDDDEFAERDLIDVIRAPAASGRDRAYAAKLLGDFYKERGELRKAIQAYRGEVTQ